MRLFKGSKNMQKRTVISRGIALSAVLFALSTSADAGEWEVLYLADTGGSRLWVTDDPAEATEIQARVISPDFAVLVSSCRSAPTGMSYLSIGQSGEPAGPSYLDESSKVSFKVDENPFQPASKLEFFQSAYDVLIPNALLMEMASGTKVVMRYGPAAHERKVFTLRGAMRALNAVDCNPLE